MAQVLFSMFLSKKDLHLNAVDLHCSSALAVDFEQVIVSVISFTVLFANQINDLCRVSSTCARGVILSGYFQCVGWWVWTGHCSSFIIFQYCLLQLDIGLFNFCCTWTLGFSCSIILRQWMLTLNKSVLI